MHSMNCGECKVREPQQHNSTIRLIGSHVHPVEAAVISYVRGLGIRPNLCGYRFLIRAILLALRTPELLDSFTKGLYPAVADYFQKSADSVERGLRNAIESAYESDPESIQAAFYYKVGRPYVSEVISMAVESIRYEMDTEV